MLTNTPSHDQERQSDRQEIILRAAARIFCAKGYDAASTREIAQATGLSKSGLYHHVPNKQDLLYQIMDRFISRFLEDRRQDCALDLPSDKKMWLMVEHHITMLAEALDEGQVTHESRRALNAEQLASYLAKRDAYQDLFITVIEEGVNAGMFRACNAFLVSHTILDILNGLLRWYAPPAPPTLDEITAHMGDLIVERLLR